MWQQFGFFSRQFKFVLRLVPGVFSFIISTEATYWGKEAPQEFAISFCIHD